MQIVRTLGLIKKKVCDLFTVYYKYAKIIQFDVDRLFTGSDSPK